MSEERLLSLCLIVRDEAPVLEECLTSFRPWVDEIVVVDTGSRDETQEIARRFGARVFEEPWDDDFAKARNASLARARGRWIFVVDADERLREGDGPRLREALRNERAAGYLVSCENLRDDGPPVHCSLLRLFRRADDVRFENAIHEQVLASLKLWAVPRDLAILPLPVHILHRGYLSKERSRKRKEERNRRIFRKQLEQHPRDPYSWYKYGDTVRHRDPVEGVRALERSIELMEELPPREAFSLVFAAEAYAVLAFDRLRNGLIEPAWRLVETACARHDVTPNLIFARGSLALHRRDFDTATEAFQSLLRYAGVVLPVPIEHGITGPIAHYGLGRAALGRRELDAAEDHYRRALADWPHYRDASIALAELLSDVGRSEEALEVLERYREHSPEDLVATMFGAKLCASRGQWERARDWLARGRRENDAPDGLTFDLGLCQLFAGDGLDALERTWEQLRGEHPEAQVARWLLGAFRGVAAPLPVAERTDRLISDVLERCLATGHGDLVERVVDDLAARSREELSAPMLHALRCVVGKT